MITQPYTTNISKGRKVLVWAIILLIMPFGFTLEKPVEQVNAFLQG